VRAFGKVCAPHAGQGVRYRRGGGSHCRLSLLLSPHTPRVLTVPLPDLGRMLRLHRVPPLAAWFRV